MRHRSMLQLFLIIAGCLLSLIHAKADGIDPDRGCSVTVRTDQPASGMKFRIYQAGILDEFAVIIPNEGYDSCTIDPDDPKKTIASLKRTAEKMPADYEAVMPESGIMKLDDLEAGVYLILGEVKETDRYILMPSPMLVFLPSRNKASEPWDYDPEISLKCRMTEIHPELTAYSVRKQWRNDSAAMRPKSITVIISDGKEERNAVLDESNHWTYSWAAEKGTVFTVREKNVPAGYSAKVTSEGHSFIIVNTWDRPAVPDTADRPDAEKTFRQLDFMWTLFLSGVLCYVIRKYV